MQAATLSLIIPVYNEAGHLEEFFKELQSKDFGCDIEWVIVDDASSDDSWAVIEGLTSEFKITRFKQSVNQGKGAAIHKGISLASGRFIAVQDADFEYDPNDISKLMKPLLAGSCDVVYGSRFHKSANQVHRTAHYAINRLLALLSNILSGLYLTDMETCYKVFSAEILRNINLESQRFGFEPEVTAKIAGLNIRIMEFPISYYPRNYLEGKKITWKDGVAALWFILKYNIFSKSGRYKEAMPKKFIPNSTQWL